MKGRSSCVYPSLRGQSTAVKECVVSARIALIAASGRPRRDSHADHIMTAPGPCTPYADRHPYDALSATFFWIFGGTAYT
jgi:hypothetical protein